MNNETINEDILKKRQFYKDRQKKYINNNKEIVSCPGCYKKVKKYYYQRHLKSSFHIKWNEENKYNELISRIEEIEKKLEKILI